MSNYLKKFLFCLLILLMPYMNIASNSVDLENNEGSTVHARKARHIEATKDDYSNASSSSKQSNSLQSDVEDSQSWASYVFSPVKTTIQFASEFVNIATHNPNKAVIILGCLAYQAMAVAANCNCVCQQQSNHNNIQFVGSFLNSGACQSACFRLPGYWELSECKNM